jgi:hypothetical protein
MRPKARVVRFVRIILAGGNVTQVGSLCKASNGSHVASLETPVVRQLISQGVLAGLPDECKPSAETRNWLRRVLADENAYLAQHQLQAQSVPSLTLNLSESPLARLAQPDAAGAAYLLPHQVEAGERFRRLFERAGLQARVTMSYGPKTGSNGSAIGDLSDMAVDARRDLDSLSQALPLECVGVLFDVCAYLKGLQTVELERGWPRRSAKLVLRIALEQLAAYFGLNQAARGPDHASSRFWHDTNRPPLQCG